MEKYYFLINSMEWGWAERVVSNFIKEYSENWKEVYLFTLKEELFYEIPKTVHYIPLSNIKNNLLLFASIPYFALKFKKILKKYKLKEGMSFLEMSNFVHILAKKNAWISFRTHINFFNHWITNKIQKHLIKRLYPKAEKIIVNSRENKHDLAEFLNISEDKIEVWYNPVDKEKIKKLSEEKLDDEILKKIKNKKVFITTWRLVWIKHHEKIIEALNEYNKKNKDWIYLIIWDWPERSNLENLVKSFWLENQIMFLWQQKNVFKYLKHSDLFLYASEVEGFPNTLLEAREMWIKIISSDFKSWAREVILWEDTDTIWKKLEYPYKGKYGIIISPYEYWKHLLTLLLD